MTAESYLEQLLENMADELNVYEIRCRIGTDEFVYEYDCFRSKRIEGQDVLWASLIFTGDTLRDMQLARDFVSEGLRQRATARVKVRQPLRSMTITAPAQTTESSR